MLDTVGKSNQPMQQARELILQLTTPADAKEKIEAFEKISSPERERQLTEYYNTAEAVAAAGDTKRISIMLRVLDHFKDTSHDRMLLHYIAQAAAANALSELRSETHPHHQDMIKAVHLIDEAFTTADKINNEHGIK